MRGLEEYIERHGRHFTMKLAEDVLDKDGILFWKPDTVMRAMNRRVWYNTNSSTEGDIIYLVNNYPSNLNSAVSITIGHLHKVNDREVAFDIFMIGLRMLGEDFDFTPYI